VRGREEPATIYVLLAEGVADAGHPALREEATEAVPV
jgi:hypothetical protein